MSRRRSSLLSLSTTRIYQKGARFYLFAREPMQSPVTFRVAKWHPLCDVAEGEKRARDLAEAIYRFNERRHGRGNMPEHLNTYRLAMLKRREDSRPAEPARVKMWEQANKEFTRVCTAIGDAFLDFDVDQVAPMHVAQFVDQWQGRRSAQVYKSRLSDFFAWCCRRGLRTDNPAREVEVEKPKPHTRYITDDEFLRIREALMVGEDGRPTQSGETMRDAVDFMYLTLQRPTEVRLLKWKDVGASVIRFTPTKTEDSSGVEVDFAITPAIREIVDRLRAKQAGAKVVSQYVFTNRKSQPYASRGFSAPWDRAVERAGVQPCTMRDIRAKALTDAKRAGYDIDALMVAAAHTDKGTTEGYIKRREVARADVVLAVPRRGN